MAAKRATPKAAKGKKSASRAPARKAQPRKPEPARSRAAAAHTRKPPSAPKKAAAPAAADAAPELRRLRPAPPAAVPAPSLLGRPAPVPDADESDSPEPGSLLAGPRNVQPYIVKRGELYMSKEQLEHFRNILNSWKRDLMVEVDRTVSHMKDEAANFPDPNDRATQEEEFSLELRTRDRERKLIRKIDDALKRIEDGSYGYCLETGEEIGIKRLEARPVATLSIEAQERRERRERQYGDRDDRYR
ncbi:MAG: RNA polymerase-binding protein DksA [Gammaproteobacteria bacterium]|nr:RNA polymerase-binding protein DksA [Gammaproteobacteria bacterium]